MTRYVVIDYQGLTPITEAFQRLGYTVCASADEVPPGEMENCDLALLCMFKEIKRPQRLWATARRMRRAGIPLITWNRDGPSHKGDKTWRLWLLRHVHFFDIYATHTLQDAAGFAPQIIYLPNAAWDSEYHLGQATLTTLRDPGRYKHDVSFFGRISSARYPEMRRREEFLKALAERLGRLGIRYLFEDRAIGHAEQRSIIQTTRVNLSFHAGCDDNYHGGNEIGREKSWGMPERCFGVPACGGFLLSDTRKHAKEDFVPGKEWIDFEDLDDCVHKIRRHLAKFQVSRDIAEAAHRRVMREHLYIHRAQTLLSAAKVWRERHSRVRTG